MFVDGRRHLAFLPGCESSSEGSSSIDVTPASTELVGQGSVLLTAASATEQELFLPLVWSVENPALGAIRE